MGDGNDGLAMIVCGPRIWCMYLNNNGYQSMVEEEQVNIPQNDTFTFGSVCMSRLLTG